MKVLAWIFVTGMITASVSLTYYSIALDRDRSWQAKSCSLGEVRSDRNGATWACVQATRWIAPVNEGWRFKPCRIGETRVDHGQVWSCNGAWKTK